MTTGSNGYAARAASAFNRRDLEAMLALVSEDFVYFDGVGIQTGRETMHMRERALLQAFPDAKVLASQPTVDHINKTVAGKLAFWGPKMGADVPGKTIVPGVLKGDSLMLEGQKLQVVGLEGKQPDRSFVWIPSLKAVVGGVVVAENIHVWMADTQTAQSHADWLQTLHSIETLKPKTVVPGHYLGESSRSLASVKFTADYIKAFDEETARAKDSAALIKAMQKKIKTEREAEKQRADLVEQPKLVLTRDGKVPRLAPPPDQINNWCRGGGRRGRRGRRR